MGQCSIRTVDPIGHLKKENKFKMKEDVFILYEDDVHFSLLVDRNEGLQPAERNEGYQPVNRN